MKERTPAASMPKAWPRPRVGIHPRECYEGLVSIMSDEIGRGEGWVGVGASSPSPFTLQERSRRGAEGAQKPGQAARGDSTSSSHL